MKNNKEAQTAETNIDDGKITREKAEELIKAQAQYPRFQYFEIDTLESSTRQRVFKDHECGKERVQATFFSNKVSEKYRNLENAGLITLDYNNFWSEEPKGVMGSNRDCRHLWHEYFRDLYTHVTFTEKAAPFIEGGVAKVANTNFDQITGIIDNRGSAEVEFDEITRTTPFGAILGYQENRMKRKVTFSKYDDGWRLTSTLDYPAEYKRDPSIEIRSLDKVRVNAGTLQSQSTSENPTNRTVTSQTNSLGQYVVGSSKAYFHNAPDFATQRKAYLIYGDIVIVQKVENGFGYIEFTNAKGNTSSGWLEMSTLTAK